MPTQPKAKTMKKPVPIKVTDSVVPRQGVVVHVMTLEVRLADMQAFGRDVRKSGTSALILLQCVGVIHSCGRLAKSFRS